MSRTLHHLSTTEFTCTFSRHKHRNQTYGPQDYTNEFGQLVAALAKDSHVPVKNNLIGPSVSGTWTPETVWNTGFISQYTASLGALAVEQ
jgi:hypothetical protein